jgi:hypothetical protein
LGSNQQGAFEADLVFAVDDQRKEAAHLLDFALEIDTEGSHLSCYQTLIDADHSTLERL